MMMRLNIIQAEFGDCFILQYGSTANPRYILIDGGPDKIFKNHLQAELTKISEQGGKIDIAVLSHVDNDHLIGILDLLAEMEKQDANNLPRTIKIDAIWHNTFDKTIGEGNDIANRVNAVVATAGAAARATMLSTNDVLTGIAEGSKLRSLAEKLEIPINSGFQNKLISLDTSSPTSTAQLESSNLRITIVGPTKANLDKLREEWLDWLAENESLAGTQDPYTMAMVDRSIPNLSSIMMLAEAEGKRMLLTGDGRGDHLIEGLKQAGLLDGSGKTHVDVLKLPHHGSDKNITKGFLESITADTYVISANGRYGNPDTSTLIWIVETARKSGRKVKIVVTNHTSSVDKLLDGYNPQDYGYEIITMQRNSNSMTIELAP
jgi:hypothetical protein